MYERVHLLMPLDGGTRNSGGHRIAGNHDWWEQEAESSHLKLTNEAEKVNWKCSKPTNSQAHPKDVLPPANRDVHLRPNSYTNWCSLCVCIYSIFLGRSSCSRTIYWGACTIFSLVLPLFLCQGNSPRLTKALYMWVESWSLYSLSLTYFWIFTPIVFLSCLL